MPVLEAVASKVASEVVRIALQQSGFGDSLKTKTGLDPLERAFRNAFERAITRFETDRATIRDNLFDESFLGHEGSSVLAQLLIRDGSPDPGELAVRWEASIGIQDVSRKLELIENLEPDAALFLSLLQHELASESDLQDLFNARALERIASNVERLAGSRRIHDIPAASILRYLKWVLERNQYIDPRGIPQTQRQVQLPLREVFVSLNVLPEASTAPIDRPLTEEHAPLDHFRRIGPEASGEVALEAVVSATPHAVLLGDPGAGKTTLLRYLAAQTAEAAVMETLAGRPARTPLLMRISAYAQDGTWRDSSLTEFLERYHRLAECASRDAHTLLLEALDRGGCLVLLDGLDEVVHADDRRGVVTRIEDFARRYRKGNRFVVTSRVAGYSDAPLTDPFRHFRVQDMTIAQAERFLDRWCPAVELAQTPDLSPVQRERIAVREADGIKKAISESAGVRRLATNPLLLTILALIHRTGAKLPQNRVELYKVAADTLARTWRAAQGVPESALVDERYLTRILGRTAYWLHLERPTGIATSEDVELVMGAEWARLQSKPWSDVAPDESVLDDVRNFLTAVRIQTGLFVERAPSRYGFMHLTFEEYYAARHLVARRRAAAPLLRNELHNARWDEPIRLALGFVGLDFPEESSELFEAALLARGEEAVEAGLEPSQLEDVLGRDFLFALRALGDQIPVDANLAYSLIDRGVAEFLQDRGSGRFRPYRALLNERLSVLAGTTIHAERVFERASDSVNLPGSPGERAASLIARGASVVPRAAQMLPGLIRSVGWERVPAIARGLAEAIRLEGLDGELAAQLMDTVKAGNGGREALPLVLAGSADIVVVASLVNAINERSRTENVPFTWAANGALSEMTKGVEHLDTFMRLDPEQHFWYEMMPGLEASIRRQRADGFTNYFASLSLRQQIFLASVGPVSQTEYGPALVKQALRANDRAVVKLAVRQAARLEYPPDLAGIVRDLVTNGGAEDVRLAAARSLAQAGLWDRELATFLVESPVREDESDGAREDRYGRVRFALASSVGSSPESAVAAPLRREALEDTLSGAGEDLQIAVGYSLARLDEAQIEPHMEDALARLFTASSDRVRVAMVESSWEPVGRPGKVAAAIRAALRDEATDVRLAALNVFLGEPIEDDLLSEILAIADDPDESPTVRARALVTAISRRTVDQTAERADLLMETLRNLEAQWIDRERAANALAQYPRLDAVDALFEALLDPDDDVRGAAARALALIARQSEELCEGIETRLRGALEHRDFEPLDKYGTGSGQDFAFEGLWALATGSRPD